jgi:multicomponent Na+:H+ antiporter subunit F
MISHEHTRIYSKVLCGQFNGDNLMVTVYLLMALFLLLTLVAGLWRVLRGPTPADRMLAAQLFGTTAVACILLLAQASERQLLHDVALVFALLAAVTATAFARRAWLKKE